MGTRGEQGWDRRVAPVPKSESSHQHPGVLPPCSPVPRGPFLEGCKEMGAIFSCMWGSSGAQSGQERLALNYRESGPKAALEEE